MAYVPAFSSSNQTTEALNTMYQVVPVMTKNLIRRVKTAALMQAAASQQPGTPAADSLQVSLPEPGSNTTSNGSSIEVDFMAWSSIHAVSGFRHPATCAGAAELAFMLRQLRKGAEPQASALHSLLTGLRVPPKVLNPVSGWSPPTDCSPDNYTGPYQMPVALIR
jgi:hypothetical protein